MRTVSRQRGSAAAERSTLVDQTILTEALHRPESTFDVRMESVKTMRDVQLKGQRVNVIPPKEL